MSKIRSFGLASISQVVVKSDHIAGIAGRHTCSIDSERTCVIDGTRQMVMLRHNHGAFTLNTVAARIMVSYVE